MAEPLAQPTSPLTVGAAPDPGALPSETFDAELSPQANEWLRSQLRAGNIQRSDVSPYGQQQRAARAAGTALIEGVAEPGRELGDALSQYQGGTAPLTAVGTPLAMAAIGAMPQGRAAKAAKALGKVGGEAAEALAPRFSHYAEEYPQHGPGELREKTDLRTGEVKIDPHTGQPRTYLGKKQTEQEEAFMEARLAIQKDMQKRGFDPMFPPGQRYDAPSALLASSRSTLVERQPGARTKQATLDKWNGMLADPAGLQRLRDAYEHGEKIGGGDRWYQIGQLHDAFRQELGQQLGDEKFKEFVYAMAGTTAGQEPEGNLMLAHLVRYAREKGVGLPGKGESWKVPVPMKAGKYGALGNIGEGQEMLRAGVTPDNPKRFNFTQNFFGKADVPTLDEQMGQIWFGKGEAPFAQGGNNPYGLFEPAIAKLAKEYGVDPRQFQEVAWAGHKNITSKGKYQPKPFITTVNEAIERTHRLTGMPREEVLKRGIIRAEVPLYGATGALGLGAAAQSDAVMPSSSR